MQSDPKEHGSWLVKNTREGVKMSILYALGCAFVFLAMYIAVWK